MHTYTATFVLVFSARRPSLQKRQQEGWTARIWPNHHSDLWAVGAGMPAGRSTPPSRCSIQDSRSSEKASAGDLLTRAALHNCRFKPEMWAKVAEEMQVPWRAAEAMHWQLGEADMARRAGVVPFSLTSVNMQQDNTRQSPTRGHMHSHSQGSMPRSDPHLLGRYAHRGGTPHLAQPPPQQQQQPPPQHHHQHPPPPHALSIPPPVPTIPPPPGSGRGPLPPRRESLPPRQPPGDLLYDHVLPAPGPGLAPIQTPGGRERGGAGAMHLPSVAELTTGVSPYSTPAYSLSRASASPSATASPRQTALQASPLGYGESSSIGGGGPATPGSGKRGRASPDAGREAIRRRH